MKKRETYGNCGVCGGAILKSHLGALAEHPRAGTSHTGCVASLSWSTVGSSRAAGRLDDESDFGAGYAAYED